MTSNARFGLVVGAAFCGGIFGSWLFAPHTADAAGAAPLVATAQPQATAGQAISVNANLPTIITVPPQGLIFKGSSGRTLVRIDEAPNMSNFGAKVTLPQTDSAGKEVAGKKATLSDGALSFESGADYKTDLNLGGLKLKGKGYGGIPASVSAPSTITLGSGSMTIESDNKKTFLSVNVVTAKDANGAAKMFSSAGVTTPTF